MSTAAAAQGTAAAEVAAAAVAVPVPVAAPAAAPAGAAVVPEPSDAPGISQEQLRVWREKFGAKSGKCTNCKCAKAGRKCHSGCRCARFCACTNKEPVERADTRLT